MIDSPSLNNLPIQGIAPVQHDDPEKIKKAATQFEALLIGQLLKSMRDSEGGWLGTGDDESASSAMEYAQEMFAQAMTAKGGLGIASMVTKGLSSASDPQAASGASQAVHE
jgi:Rod binding domain-containing protein